MRNPTFLRVSLIYFGIRWNRLTRLIIFNQTMGSLKTRLFVGKEVTRSTYADV
jgi:hypothetical protein